MRLCGAVRNGGATWLRVLRGTGSALQRQARWRRSSISAGARARLAGWLRGGRVLLLVAQVLGCSGRMRRGQRVLGCCAGVCVVGRFARADQTSGSHAARCPPNAATHLARSSVHRSQSVSGNGVAGTSTIGDLCPRRGRHTAPAVSPLLAAKTPLHQRSPEREGGLLNLRAIPNPNAPCHAAGPAAAPVPAAAPPGRGMLRPQPPPPRPRTPAVAAARSSQRRQRRAGPALCSH